MTRTPKARGQPHFPRLFHGLAKIWSCFRHRRWLLRGRAVGWGDSHVEAQDLVQQAALAEAASGRYPSLSAIPVRALSPASGRRPTGALTETPELIFQDQCVDMRA